VPGLADIVLAAGALALGWQGYQTIDSSIFQSRKTLDNGCFARMTIPRLQLNSIVCEGDGDNTLRRSLGHIPKTPFPWQTGNSAIAGHRDTIFSSLQGVREHDHIKLQTTHGAFEYEVQWTKIVWPTNTAVLESNPGSTELTLVTCYPFRYIGHAPQRFIVRAARVALSDQPSEFSYKALR
jgi:sortase A